MLRFSFSRQMMAHQRSQRSSFEDCASMEAVSKAAAHHHRGDGAALQPRSLGVSPKRNPSALWHLWDQDWRLSALAHRSHLLVGSAGICTRRRDLPSDVHCDRSVWASPRVEALLMTSCRSCNLTQQLTPNNSWRLPSHTRRRPA